MTQANIMVSQTDSNFLLLQKKKDLNINISPQSKVIKKGYSNKKDTRNK